MRGYDEYDVLTPKPHAIITVAPRRFLHIKIPSGMRTDEEQAGKVLEVRVVKLIKPRKRVVEAKFGHDHHDHDGAETQTINGDFVRLPSGWLPPGCLLVLGFGFLRIIPRIMIQKMAQICQVGSRWVDVRRASTVTCLRDGGRNWERRFGWNICRQPCDCAGLQFHNGQLIFHRKRFSCITEMVMCHSNYRPCAVKKPPISDVPSFLNQRT